jgi:hypothetical protein
MSKLIVKNHKSAENEAMKNINVGNLDKKIYLSAEDEAMKNINVPNIDKKIYVSAEDEALGNLNVPNIDKKVYLLAEDEAMGNISLSFNKNDYASAEDEALKNINVPKTNKENHVSAEDEALKGINIIQPKNNYVSAEDEALKGINLIQIKNNHVSAEDEALKGINIITQQKPIHISSQENKTFDDYPKVIQLKKIMELIEKIKEDFKEPTTIDNVKYITTELKNLASSLDDITVTNTEITNKLIAIEPTITNDNMEDIKSQLNIIFKALEMGKVYIGVLMKRHWEFYRVAIILLTNLKMIINKGNRIDDNFIMMYFLIHLIGDELNDNTNYYNTQKHVNIFKLLKFTSDYYKVIDDNIYDQKMEELRILNNVYADKIKNDMIKYKKSGKKFSDMKMYVNDYLMILNKEKYGILL